MTGTDQTDALGDRKRRVIIVTGLSGAGKSSALRAFEDINYHVVDNCPLPMLIDLVTLEIDLGDQPLALGVDIRSLAFSAEDFVTTVSRLRAMAGVDLHVLLMDASDAVLVRRFSESRRKHPLTHGDNADLGNLRQAIQHERDMMDHVRQVIDGIIDTSDKTSTDTRRMVLSRFALKHKDRMTISVISFGYSNGIPRDSDLVFDVRFLRNPHYVPDLQPLTGCDERVANYVRADEGYAPFMRMLEDQLRFLVPRYRDEGKTYLTLAFGCTGGKHRSVAVAEAVASLLGTPEKPIALDHRDIPTAQQRRRQSDLARSEPQAAAS